MFTLEQINQIHERLGKQASLPEYLRALNGIGVETQDSFVCDGHSEYSGKGQQSLTGAATYEPISIADFVDKDEMLRQLNLHGEGKKNYFEMCRGLAESGIEKWSFDTKKMTLTYCDKQGNAILLESIN